MTVLLEIRDLLVHREKKAVLRVDRLDVEQGEILAVVGPNGAGKSTLLLAIAQLLKPERGVIRLAGHQPGRQTSLERRRRMSLVLQEPTLVDRKVFDNVAMGLRFRHASRAVVNQRVDAWLELMKISHLRNRKAGQISGGEAQRVSLARAFAIEPELLLLDEPFSSLDAPTRSRLLEDLRCLLAQTGTTTIFVTHDLGEASRLGGRMAIILKGQVEQWGEPEGIYKQPKNAEVAAFLGIE